MNAKIKKVIDGWHFARYTRATLLADTIYENYFSAVNRK
jgi:hypothetical protein